jgi:SSS family solute:Na+ symporter
LWKRASQKAAFITLCSGSCLGFIVFVLDRYKEYTGWNISFMMGSFYLFVVCSTILVFMSWISPHVHSAESRSLVWEHPLDMLRQPGWKGLLNYKFLSLLLLLSVAAVYLILG